MPAGGIRAFSIPQSGCGVPANAGAYALNITVVPRGVLQFLTIWPADQPQPFVSTLNSFQGAIVANAAIVPASAADGSVKVFTSDASDVVIDVNGYFAPVQQGTNISIQQFRFDPTPAAVAAGSRVTWTNLQSGVQHTVVADGGQFSSAVLNAGEAFSTMPSTPGTYNYHCSIHPFMTGTVVVQ
jgi:plastocyanin